MVGYKIYSTWLYPGRGAVSPILTVSTKASKEIVTTELATRPIFAHTSGRLFGTMMNDGRMQAVIMRRA